MGDPVSFFYLNSQHRHRLFYFDYDLWDFKRALADVFNQAIQEATASEPLTLDEEYENQESWRESPDKLTFILCQPIAQGDETISSVEAGGPDVPDKMIGDINFFLYPLDNNEEDETKATPGNWCVGEIDIMIAGHGDRGKGLGSAAVSTFLHYIHWNQDALVTEYQSISREQEKGTGPLELKLLMVKIRATNAHSIALFKGLGFKQEGDVNYFGEVKMVLKDFGRIAKRPEGYEEVKYLRPAN